MERIKVDNESLREIIHERCLISKKKGIKSIDVSDLDTSEVTDMSALSGYPFGKEHITKIKGLENWNTSKVRKMNALFSGFCSVKSLDLSTWDTSEVTNMSYMFGGCYKLEKLNIENFNYSNVVDLKNFFFDCKSLYYKKIKGYDQFEKSLGYKLLKPHELYTTLDQERLFQKKEKLKNKDKKLRK